MCRYLFLISKMWSYKIKKLIIMGDLLYLIAVVLVIAWLIAFVGYGTGGIMHILLVIAFIAVLLRIIQGKRPI